MTHLLQKLGNILKKGFLPRFMQNKRNIERKKSFTTFITEIAQNVKKMVVYTNSYKKYGMFVRPLRSFDSK